MNIKKKLSFSVSVITLFTFSPVVVHASAFQLNEQSAAEVGMALAGSGVAPDASVQFFNPAGIAALSGFNFLGGGQLIVTGVNFHNQGTSSVLGTPVTGDASADSNAAVAEGYASYQIDDRFTVGLASYVPFGLATRYPDNSSVRYFTDTTSLRTIEINPNVAFRLNNQLSFGAGPVVRWSDGEFSTHIDDGGIATGVAARSGVPLPLAAGLAGPEGNDARLRVHGTDWDLGYKLGVLFQPDKQTNVGIAYHSAMQSTLEGDGTIDNSGVNSPGARLFAASPLAPQSARATAKIDYPDYITVSASRQIDDRLKLAGDFQWTNWSRLKGIFINFANGQTGGEGFNWNDGYRFSVGGEYKLDPKWTLRTGAAYEISPIGDDADRTPRDPDTDRFWISGGVGYQLTQNVGFDFGYSHLFAIDGGTVRTNSIAGQLVGRYEDDSADIISADMTYHF